MKSAWTMLLLLLVLWGYVHEVSSQGGLISPPGRSAMWAFLGNSKYAKEITVNKDYHKLNCGGRLVTPSTFATECGSCGDPINHADPSAVRPNEAPGGKFAIKKVVGIYQENDVINVTLDIVTTPNAGGYHQFSICESDPETKVTRDCFVHHLKWGYTSVTKIPALQREGLASYSLKLPAGLLCQFCVLQWLWIDGLHSCDPPGSTNCGKKVVANCADIRIVKTKQEIPSDFDWPRYDDYASVNSATPAPSSSGIPVLSASSIGAVSVVPVSTTDEKKQKVSSSKPPPASQSLVSGSAIPVAAGAAGAVGFLSGNKALGTLLIFMAMLLYLNTANQPNVGWQGNVLPFEASPFMIPPVPAFANSPPVTSFSTSSSFMNPTFQQPLYNRFMSSPYLFYQNSNAFASPSVATLQSVPSAGFAISNSFNGNTRLPISAIESIQPQFTSFGNTQSSFGSVQTVPSGLTSVGNVRLRNTGFGNLQQSASSTRIIQPRITSVGNIQPGFISAGNIQPGFTSIGNIQPRLSSVGNIQQTFPSVGTLQPQFPNIPNSQTTLNLAANNPSVVSTFGNLQNNIIPTQNVNSLTQTSSLSRLGLLPTIRREFDQDPKIKRKHVPIPKKKTSDEECKCKGRMLLFDYICWKHIGDRDACNKEKDLCYCATGINTTSDIGNVPPRKS